jgi:hypothetical protein
MKRFSMSILVSDDDTEEDIARKAVAEWRVASLKLLSQQISSDIKDFLKGLDDDDG